MAIEGSSRKRWSEEETVLALYLYFQLPFGKLHSGNPEIQELAAALGRTNSSVAMKLANFTSLDPKITESGRKGLDGASKLDRATYAEFGQDWSGLVARAEELWTSQVDRQIAAAQSIPPASHLLHDKRSEFKFEPWQGESTTPAIVNQRVGQDFFRRAVLANYGEACCITGRKRCAPSANAPSTGIDPATPSGRAARKNASAAISTIPSASIAKRGQVVRI